jgi:hypothetical protein
MIAESPQSGVGNAKGNGIAPGVIVPHAVTWPRRALAAVLYALTRAVAITLRYEWQYDPELMQRESGPVIFCTWHNRLALSLLMYEEYARRRGQPPRLAAMVSASRDGGVLARVLEHYGAQPVRGSSSRRGPQALLELTTWAERGYDLAITPDGPRGPCYVVREGVIALAQVTGLPVVPAGYELRGKFRLNSWDRFLVPLPFGKAVLKLGEPFHVPRELTDGAREEWRRHLEDQLKALNTD